MSPYFTNSGCITTLAQTNVFFTRNVTRNGMTRSAIDIHRHTNNGATLNVSRKNVVSESMFNIDAFRLSEIQNWMTTGGVVALYVESSDLNNFYTDFFAVPFRWNAVPKYIASFVNTLTHNRKKTKKIHPNLVRPEHYCRFTWQSIFQS